MNSYEKLNELLRNKEFIECVKGILQESNLMTDDIKSLYKRDKSGYYIARDIATGFYVYGECKRSRCDTVFFSTKEAAQKCISFLNAMGTEELISLSKWLIEESDRILIDEAEDEEELTKDGYDTMSDSQI